MPNDICWNIIHAYPIDHVFPFMSGSIGIGMACIALSYVFAGCIMLFWIYDQRRKALEGVDGAAMYVIFPIYTPFMWVSVLSDVFIGIVMLFLPYNLRETNTWGSAAGLALAYAFQHFVLEGIAFILMQYGCGFQAGRKAGVLAFCWAIVTFLIEFFYFRYGASTIPGAFNTLWVCVQAIFYLCLWLVPEKYIFRRPALYPYAKFWGLFRLLYLISNSLILYSIDGSVYQIIGYCGNTFGDVILFALAKPVILYTSLLSDSKWWQGISQPNYQSSLSSTPSLASHGSVQPGVRSLSSTRFKKVKYEQLRNPLMGVEVGFNDALELAQEVDNLRAQGSVKLLNFAYLQIEKKTSLLGSGSFSRVYPGRYRGENVAIKLVFTPDLNPEVIRRCWNEAEILSQIGKDENVVEILGVCVLPPSVCLVLERCQYGSLSDIIRGSETLGRPPLRLSFADRMFISWGAAKGLRALHRSSGSLCHRDIKSFNFLVNSQLVVKIADLELGLQGIEEETLINSQRAIMASWQAPEIVSGGCYVQASDVYSLSIVLWEIVITHFISLQSEKSSESVYSTPSLYGKFGIPYGDFRSHREIHQQILAGARPPIPSELGSKFTDIMVRGWDAKIENRPSIEEVANVLEECWKDCIYKHLRSTSVLVDLEIVKEVHQQELLNKHSLRMTSYYESKKAPPSSLLVALSCMEQEMRWRELENEGAILVVAPEDPYYILWATKKWTQLMGFMLNEVLASSVSLVEGGRSNKILLSQSLLAASKGVARHLVTVHYRRDGSSFMNSLHIFPIFADVMDTSPRIVNGDLLSSSSSMPNLNIAIDLGVSNKDISLVSSLPNDTSDVLSTSFLEERFPLSSSLPSIRPMESLSGDEHYSRPPKESSSQDLVPSTSSLSSNSPNNITSLLFGHWSSNSSNVSPAGSLTKPSLTTSMSSSAVNIPKSSSSLSLSGSSSGTSTPVQPSSSMNITPSNNSISHNNKSSEKKSSKWSFSGSRSSLVGSSNLSGKSASSNDGKSNRDPGVAYLVLQFSLVEDFRSALYLRQQSNRFKGI